MKHEKQIGEHGERLARSVLSGLGLEMIEKIGTPVKLVPVKSASLKNAYFVVWGEKVAGDHRALLGNGRSVLIEVKTISGRNLAYGDLREHQPGKLREHADLGGLSLLVWVHDDGVFVMRWPIQDFGPGKGIAPAQAQSLHEETVEYIQEQLAAEVIHE